MELVKSFCVGSLLLATLGGLFLLGAHFPVISGVVTLVVGTTFLGGAMRAAWRIL